MEENILLDAIERYRNGEMDDQEKLFFEELRKNNPDIDQVAAEHTYFLGNCNIVELRVVEHIADQFCETVEIGQGLFRFAFHHECLNGV